MNNRKNNTLNVASHVGDNSGKRTRVFLTAIFHLLGWTFAWMFLLCSNRMLFGADADLDAAEQSAIASAVEHVTPSVVRIETIGGLERVGQMALGTGATTGLIVDPDGYIISSAFNFINKPSSILVRLPDGTRKPATLVATDHARMLVLLKIEASKPLPVCEIVPSNEMRIGQWAIAVGRTFDGEQPNMTVGILSAVGRIWGKAIQTDAVVSPNNYGGPLIDIRGRVLGVIVPLSPEATDEVAGYEWYDSGIGFAIPADHIQKILPRLKNGENLEPGILGVGIKGPNLYTGEPVVAACPPRSPAFAAGVRPGDVVVEIDGRKIVRAIEIREEIGRRYAGDTMHLVLERDKKPIAANIELVAKLDPYQQGFLGILPMRDNAGEGVVVRYVYPDSPAAKAGIVPGDVLVALAGKPISDRIDLRENIVGSETGEEIALEFRHGDVAHSAKIVLASLPEGLPPAELPLAHGKSPVKGKNTSLAVGAMPLKISEYPNDAWVYVPRNCQEGLPSGIVVWLHGPNGFDWQELLAIWKPICDRYDLILVAPKANDTAQWMPHELGLIDRLIADVAEKYSADPTRVVLFGQDSGGAMAFAAASHNRDVIQAVAVVDAMPMNQLAENEPLNRLAIYSANAKKSRLVSSIDAAIAAMRAVKIPVTVKSLGETPRTMNPEELMELARWIDMLDRI